MNKTEYLLNNFFIENFAENKDYLLSQKDNNLKSEINKENTKIINSQDINEEIISLLKSKNLKISNNKNNSLEKVFKDKYSKFKNMIISFKTKIDPIIVFKDLLKPDLLFFTTFPKSNNINLFINESIPSKKNIKDKYNKFKNMIISFKAKIDPTIAFRNPLKPDWYEVGYKTGIIISNTIKASNDFYNNVIDFLTEASNKANVLFKNIENSKNSLQSKFYLIGEKKNVKKLEKKFSTLFKMLGIDADETLHTSNITDNLTKDELMQRIKLDLEKKISAIKDSNENTYDFTVLEGLTPRLQIDMLQNLIWPKVLKLIKDNIALSQEIQKTKNDNMYIKFVLDFSERNNLNPDLVIHSLKHNEELLRDYPGFKKLLINKDKIIENANKYAKIVSNTFAYLGELIKISQDMQNIVNNIDIDNQNLKNNFFEVINNSVVLQTKERNLTFEKFKENFIATKKENNNRKSEKLFS